MAFLWCCYAQFFDVVHLNNNSMLGGGIINKNLIRYSVQIAMLKQLLAKKLITEKEYNFAKNRLMKDYQIISDITS